MAVLFVLIHAPVLGPASWQPVADELAQAGHAVTVPGCTDFAAEGPPYAEHLVARWAEQVSRAVQDSTAAASTGPGGTGPGSTGPGSTGPGSTGPGSTAPSHPGELVVLVPHSGAGPFAGQLASAVAAQVGEEREVAVIFADAGLPRTSGPTPVVDEKFLPYLRQLAVDGVVPAWHDWWPDAELAELFSSEAARAAVLMDARPLPLAFFEDELPPAPADEPAPRAAYLLLSESYRDTAREASRAGWPVAELHGSHLHALDQPAEVAAALIRLADRLSS